jgi:dihydroorotase
VGQPCSFVLFDPDQEWVVGAEPLASRSGNTPLLGVPLRGRVMLTVSEGAIVHLSPSLELPGLAAVPGG